MGLLVVAPNGEIVELGTGFVRGFENTQFPQLTTDAATLLRYLDGVSAERLGSVPKIIVISRAEQRLLSKIRPWKWLKYAMNQDYYRLIRKINKNKLSIHRSIQMTLLWKDPVLRALRIEAVQSGMDNYWAKLSYRDQIQRGKRIWDKRRETFGPNGYPKDFKKRDQEKITYDHVKHNRNIAWKKIHYVMNMLFGGIVDEDAVMYPCPHCKRVLRTRGALTGHITREHPDKVPPRSIKNKSITVQALWDDPDSTFNSAEYKKAHSNSMNAPSYRKNMRNVMREVYAWKKLPTVMKMLYGGAVVEKEMYICTHCGKAFPKKKGLTCHTTKMHLKLRVLDELELQSYQSMVWAYHTNGYTELTTGQKSTLRSSGLIKHNYGHKKGKVISLSRFGRDILSTIDANNAPLVRL